MRIFLISLTVVFGVLLSGCQTGEKEKTVSLSSGKTVSISFEKETVNEKVTKLAVDAVTTEKLKTEVDLEKDVTEIWESVRENVENDDLDEAVIRYKYSADYVNESNDPEKVFVVSVFLIEKIENGTWKIDKIG
ncbi:MAG: hypothetical protein KIS76_12875 [Pyrinomonadaceae bacterium]|nr:hypothetical protein [Pyrinomonadaceae bacterium]